MIDIICHPDRSAAEWRDLLFGWVSIHAKRCDYGANFRNMTIHSSSTNTYRLKPKLASSNPALTLQPREFESHFKTFYVFKRLQAKSAQVSRSYDLFRSEQLPGIDW